MAEGGGQKPERTVQEKPFPCDQCTRSYLSENALFKHYVTTHFDDDLEEFGRTESTSASADRRPSEHEKLEEKSQVHKCLICDLTFDRRSQARRHSRQEHPKELAIIVPLPPPLSPLPPTPALGTFSAESITQAAARARGSREAAAGKAPTPPLVVIISDDESGDKSEPREGERSEDKLEQRSDDQLERDESEDILIDITEAEAERARRAPLDEPELLEEFGTQEVQGPSESRREIPVIIVDDSPPPSRAMETPRVCAVATVTSGPQGSRIAHRVLPERLQRHYLMELLNSTKTTREIANEESQKYAWTEEETASFDRLLGHMRYGILGGINGCKRRLPKEDSAEAMGRYRKVLQLLKEEIPHPGEC
jgi:hypothetical protein